MYSIVKKDTLHTYILRKEDINILQDIVLVLTRLYKVSIHTRYGITVNVCYIRSKDIFKVTVVDSIHKHNPATYVDTVCDVGNIVLRILGIET